MSDYELAKDIMEIKNSIKAIEEYLNGRGESCPTPEQITFFASVGIDLAISEVQVGGGKLSFKLVGDVKCNGKEAKFLDSKFTLTAAGLCEERGEFKNDLFVVKDQKVCLIFADGVIEFCCVARFRPIPQTETTICKKINVPLP